MDLLSGGTTIVVQSSGVMMATLRKRLDTEVRCAGIISIRSGSLVAVYAGTKLKIVDSNSTGSKSNNDGVLATCVIRCAAD